MRVLSSWFVARWRDRVLNIHPSLLPAFPGLDTHSRALAAGVRFAGCTVHFVRAEVDAGPIIVQGVVPVRIEDTVEALAARVLQAEHRCYPLALELVASGRARVVDERVVIEGAEDACDGLDQSRTDVTSGPDVIMAQRRRPISRRCSNAEGRAARRLAALGVRRRDAGASAETAAGRAVRRSGADLAHHLERFVLALLITPVRGRADRHADLGKSRIHLALQLRRRPASRRPPHRPLSAVIDIERGVVLCRGRTSGVVPGYRQTTGVAAGRALSDPFFSSSLRGVQRPAFLKLGRAAHKPRGACRKRYIT